MKRFLEVERTRRDYHANAARNSAHRASLMVPELPGAMANISFLNHFLLKRKYGSVACRITAIDPEGARIESRLFPVEEPRVYIIPLSGMVDAVVDSYMVEFFAAQNLFIPFPAVMINHVGEGFHNSVHAYNRVLNDVFENDEINTQHQREAAIDVRRDEKAESFLVFHAGPQAVVDGVLEAALQLPDGTVRHAEYRLNVPKLCHHVVRLSALFPDLEQVTGGVLKVRQPRQFLFYGRILVGQITSDGRFSANHSYYDCADFPEYWDNAASSVRTYPYLGAYENLLRCYPIMSPGKLAFDLELFDAAGSRLAADRFGEMSTPDGAALEASVSGFADAEGIDHSRISAFRVSATPIGGNTPTRVNHQLVYRSGGLESSINISLGNPNVFTPADKTGYGWGQVPMGADLHSTLGLVSMMPKQARARFDVVFYGECGELARRRYEFPDSAARELDPAEEIGADALPATLEEGTYLWYVVTSDRPDVTAFTATRHLVSDHVVGEHSF